jgi:hypothetical protein
MQLFATRCAYESGQMLLLANEIVDAALHAPN